MKWLVWLAIGVLGVQLVIWATPNIKPGFECRMFAIIKAISIDELQRLKPSCRRYFV
jgi:hypothetical protein